MLHVHKWRSLLGSVIIAASLLFTFGSSASAATTSTLSAATSTNACPPLIQYGSSGTWVTVLQYRLNSLIEQGYFSDALLSTDGSFGNLTKGAVSHFQSAVSIGVDGQVGNETWTALGFCEAGHMYVPDGGLSQRPHTPPAVQYGSSGTWVKVLQSRLNYWLYIAYINEPGAPVPSYLVVDGSFGSQTQAAVENFQSGNGSAFGLTVDGKVGPQTWSALGMGY